MYIIVISVVIICVSSIVIYNHVKSATTAAAAESHCITPIGDDSFDYTKVEPEVFRPFNKPNKIYKWSMALRNISPNDLFIIDKDYLKLIKLRQKSLKQFPEITTGFHESCIPIIKEFYLYVLKFLINRYPMYFIKSKTRDSVHNKLTGVDLPLQVDDIPAQELLVLLGQTITEDFLMLLDNNDKHPGEYCLRGFTGCAPGGVDNSSRLNMPITAIHEPIPGFLEKLKLSMIKFFNRLKPTEFMTRNNWFIQYTNPPRMFFFIGESEKTVDHKMSLDNFQCNKRRMNPRLLDFNQVFFRNEKQNFIKLPKTNAVVMLVKTYVTPLPYLRNVEKLGVELAEAIDGIQGNPRDYKGVDIWGDCMKKYLLNETNGLTDEIYHYEFEY